VHRHTAAPCHTACPAGEDAQAYLALVEEEHFQQAWETLVDANPLPAITGRVCHHPCESVCNRGQYDEAIAVHNVERFLGDRALAEGWDYPVPKVAPDAPQVAVVGAGPAGLSAAYHLLRRGLRVTLFEALPEAGGLLRTAIPAYRLPKPILDGEVEHLLGTGIEFRPGALLGCDIALDELQAQYGAVFLAPGTQRSREWSIDGATPGDLHIGLDLLNEWMEVGEIPNWSSVAIVGAGNTAVDLASVIKRAGVGEVHIISHKAIPAPDVPPADTMPAIPREITQALEERVVIHEHRGVQRLILRGERVTGVEMVHMKKLPDKDGRLRRVAFEGTETLLHVEQVIPAIGQIVDPQGIEPLLGDGDYFQLDDWGGSPIMRACSQAGMPGVTTAPSPRPSATAAAPRGPWRPTSKGRSCPRQGPLRHCPMSGSICTTSSTRPDRSSGAAPGAARRGMRGDRAGAGHAPGGAGGGALLLLRQLLRLRQLLDPVSRCRGAEDQGGRRRRQPLRVRLRLLQGLRALCPGMPLRLHRDAPRGVGRVSAA
jgi:NADPH-dependent glutamate synthase beta subunit-like oxidoreductase